MAAIISATLHPPMPYQLHIAVAPTKLNDRFEWFLEKATEIGIHEITPIFCDRSERRSIRQERMEKVVLAAMKQSLHPYLPQLNDAIPFETFVQGQHSGDRFLAHCGEGEKIELKARVRPNTRTTILIGPEGDFSSREIGTALERGFLPVALGATRLRTETAAIVACATLALANT
jgi:16S rRNA (uracil1498-N3)-methyltransferase